MTASTRDGGRLSTREKRFAAAGIASVALTASALAAEPADAATFTKPYCTGNILCEFSQGGFATTSPAGSCRGILCRSRTTAIGITR